MSVRLDRRVKLASKFEGNSRSEFFSILIEKISASALLNTALVCGELLLLLCAETES